MAFIGAPRRLSYFACLLLLAHPILGDTLTVTVTQASVFLAQRSCAIYCYVNGFDGVLNPFGCPSNPLENACWCRTDIQGSAANSVSSCVSQACSGNSVDVSSATSIYYSYCSQNGYVAAQATPAGNNGANTGAATTGGSSSPTQTASNNNNGNGGSGNGNAACGNGISNVSGVNVDCGSKSDGRLTADVSNALLTWAVGLAMAIQVWLIL